MKKIGIIVGEDADIPAGYIKENNISVYSFHISSEGNKTSQPSVGYFKELFENKLKEYDELLVFTISSQLSGCYNSAVQAQKSLFKNAERVLVFDSQLTTGAEAFLVLKSIEYIQQKISILEIVNKLNHLISSINLIGTLDDTTALEGGGRLNKVQGLIVKQMIKMNIRPVLTFKDGRITPLKIKINTKDKVSVLINELKANHMDTNSYIITHANAQHDAEELKRQMEKIFGKNSVQYLHEVSPVLKVHLGDGVLIVSYCTQ